MFVFLSSSVKSGTEFPTSCSFNCGSSETGSPWNFHVDFEDNSWKSLLQLTPTSKKVGGSGSDRIKIEEESGNKFISLTVKDGWGPSSGRKNNPTERTEIETSKIPTFGKDVWYGFRIKVPPGHPIIDDRVLITQFKHRVRGNPSPMISIYQYGMNDVRIGLSVCGKSGGRGSHQTSYYLDGNRPLMCGKNWVTGKFLYEPTDDFKKFVNTEWSDIVIGTRVTNTKDGFVKIFFNKQLIYTFSGPTYGWGKVSGTNVRIGPYRDGDESGEGYPPQTFHFDDFVIGSNQEEIVSVLWN